MNPILEMLSNVPLFAGLGPSQLSMLASAGTRSVYMPKQTLMTAGEPIDGAVLVLTGSVHCVQGAGDDAKLIDVTPGSLLMELAMLIETNSTNTFVASSTTKALCLGRKAFHQLVQEDRIIAEHLIGRLTMRLHRMADEMKSADRAFADSMYVDADELFDTNRLKRSA